MDPSDTDKSLTLGSIVGWVGWIFSHLKEVNELLQTVLLVTSIFATVAAFIYHRSNTKRRRSNG